LTAYSRFFNFVEVNSTFYIYPRLSLVRTWRRRVPQDFEFAVKCHRDLTHRFQLEPCDASHNVMETMLRICKMLRSQVLVIQTSPALLLDDQKLRRVREFLSSIDLQNLTLAWEVRGPPSGLSPSLRRLMQDFNITCVVDLTKTDPLYQHELIYSRLFGHELTMKHFEDIMRRLRQSNAKKAYVTFHSLKMYEDGQNFIQYVKDFNHSCIAEYRTPRMA
jgi:uncharacterized protein YecE (DUF72 family)